MKFFLILFAIGSLIGNLRFGNMATSVISLAGVLMQITALTHMRGRNRFFSLAFGMSIAATAGGVLLSVLYLRGARPAITAVVAVVQTLCVVGVMWFVLTGLMEDGVVLYAMRERLRFARTLYLIVALLNIVGGIFSFATVMPLVVGVLSCMVISLVVLSILRASEAYRT